MACAPSGARCMWHLLLPLACLYPVLCPHSFPMPSLLVLLCARGPFLNGFIGGSLAHAYRSQDTLAHLVSGPCSVADHCLCRKGSWGMWVTGKSNARPAYSASVSALPCSPKGLPEWPGPQQAVPSVLDFPSPALPRQRVCSCSMLT